jgi:peptidoglycan/xylan/chitin deacetylase (PgdA/CDA1 family)
VTAGIPELHLFVIWSRGREHERAILADIAAEFGVLDVLEVSWTAARFADNLTRFYGEALPSGSEKERHCGNGPFLVVVVRDREPMLELRRVRGRRLQVVDVHMLEAKERYRSWTGGGHRVHATLDPAEFAHDLYLLLGRLPSYYDGAREWDGQVTPWAADLVGTDGWRSLDELLTALEVTLGRVALREPFERGQRLVLDVDDAWWAAVVANGRPGLRDPWARRHEVDLAGEKVPLELHASEQRSRKSRLRELAGGARARAIDLVHRLTAAKVGAALVYHRVGDPQDDPRSTLVPRLGLEAFTRQVQLLRRRYRLVAASELPQAVAQRRRGGRFPVALTFDDNLWSHARLAGPLLQESGVPATFFLNGVPDGRAFWWEDLQAAVDRQLLPDHEQRAGIRDFAATIEALPQHERRELAARLRRRAGVRVEPRLTTDAVVALARHGFEIGFHTLEHDLLTALDDASLPRALADGRDELAREIGRPISLLAYPHGKADERVAAAARAVGYELAYAGSSRPVRADASPMLLPRWEPPFSAGAEFELALARMLRG